MKNKNSERHSYNFKRGTWEHTNPPYTMVFVEFLGKLTRALILIIVLAAIFFAARYKHMNTYPPIIETAEASESTHYTIEYFVDGQRYVRELNKEMFVLVAGTANDFGINQNHLLALCLQEGTEFVGDTAYACSPTAVGDNGQAFGAFQIHTGINHVSVDDAKHPYFSARWTAERMLRKGYETNPKYAMQCHNSCGERGIQYGNRVWQIARTLKIVSTNNQER
jgi:hypothetical protein